MGREVATGSMSNSYVVEIRDSHGCRETCWFADRGLCLDWCQGVVDNDVPEEIEIMFVAQTLADGDAPVTLYSSLGKAAPLTWDELIAFLS